MKTIGERIAWAREHAEIGSREALGVLVGVERQTVDAWEKGTVIPPISRIQAVSDVTGVAPCWLAFGVGSAVDGRAGGQYTAIDPELLGSIISFVGIEVRRRKLSPSTQAVGLGIAKIYDYLSQDKASGPPTPEAIKRLMALVGL